MTAAPSQIGGEKSRVEPAVGRAQILGMPLDALTEEQALSLIAERVDGRVGTWVLTPNLDILRHYRKRPELRGLFHAEQAGADILLADGMPLIWASKLSGRRPRLPARVPGSTMVLSLAKLAAERGWKLFLLGGAPGDADRAAAVLQAKHRDLVLAGTLCPPRGFEKNPEEMAKIREVLTAANPDLVYVALGFPKQELLIRELRQTLPTATFVGVGISLSFIAGTVQRAPRWLQKIGLEWTHRLVQEPKRLFKRYILQDLPFAMLVLFPRSILERVGSRFTRQS
jgi:N-acetylglucosaminyldiphosphoundecaprenol N-acetyl-beta-D-mannosaminyltransferase